MNAESTPTEYRLTAAGRTPVVVRKAVVEQATAVSALLDRAIALADTRYPASAEEVRYTLDRLTAAYAALIEACARAGGEEGG